MTEIICVVDAKSRLGEGPCWDDALGRLWWVDIHGHTIHYLDPVTGIIAIFETPGPPGSLAPRIGGGLVLAMGDGFYYVDPDCSTFEPVVMPEAHVPFTRFNDGRTDRQGRFWAGSIFEATHEPVRPIAALYRLDPGGICTRVLGGIGISNGLAWSPDGCRMYHTDSLTPAIWTWDYDPNSGEIENRRQFVDLSDIDAVADGATVDADGCYWVALPFKGRVHCYDPDGQLMREIVFSVDSPTCCEFGGANLDTLYVTSATFSRSSAELGDQPLAGGLFAINPGVRGLAGTPFAG